MTQKMLSDFACPKCGRKEGWTIQVAGSCNGLASDMMIDNRGFEPLDIHWESFEPDEGEFEGLISCCACGRDFDLQTLHRDPNPLRAVEHAFHRLSRQNRVRMAIQRVTRSQTRQP